MHGPQLGSESVSGGVVEKFVRNCSGDSVQQLFGRGQSMDGPLPLGQ